MKGFVPTPAHVVDLMVARLFGSQPPDREARLLDPGCGTGEFIEGVLRWCAARHLSAPQITGVESDPRHVSAARKRFAAFSNVRVVEADFLAGEVAQYDYIIGNPPYVPLTGLDESERAMYRRSFATAHGRFDLYVLFFEQALRSLSHHGRLVFITPEKFLYVGAASKLRMLLAQSHIEELLFLPEDTFGDLVTYPVVSAITKSTRGPTQVVHRDGSSRPVTLGYGSGSWMPGIQGARKASPGPTLADICARVSCGVATGADSVFVVADAELTPQLRQFARPTLSGRELRQYKELQTKRSMLLPYAPDGSLLPEADLGGLLSYLADPARRERLMRRTCVARKPWYAFHETPPMSFLLRPKILCKDIGATPFFVPDRNGSIVPRHSVYYIVPSSRTDLEDLTEYLNSPYAHGWFKEHCQRAANNFLRLQSHVLKQLPVPNRFKVDQSEFFDAAVG